MSGPVHIHAGAVVHSMDHYVLDLQTSNGSTAYFTIYQLSHMDGLGSGTVALIRTHDETGLIDLCLADTPGLGQKMQDRLRAIHQAGGRAPAVGIAADPLDASLRRVSTEGSVRWVVESVDHLVEATWHLAEPPFWVSAPAGTFHPDRDYVATMLSCERADLVVDGHRVHGQPYAHEWFEGQLGRPFSSCHIALAETAIESV